MVQVVKLSASWCMPCHAYHPIFEEVSKMDEFKEYQFFEFDVEQDEQGKEISQMIQARGIPTTIIIKDGMLVARQTGLMQKQNLIDFITQNA